VTSDQPKRLPPLLMLRAFEATGRTGSMRKAAQDLDLDHTAVSRHVHNLEGWLGCKLLHAGPRGIVLTEQGRALLATASAAFAQIIETANRIRPAESNRALRIWCIPGLATRWLTPRLGEIERLLPGVDILLRATDVVPDFDRDEADVFIGFSDFDSLPAGAQPLIRPGMFPVASARWLAEHGRPPTLSELIRLRLLHEDSHRQWTQWLQRAGVSVDRRLKGLRLWDASLGLDAALSHQGVALTNRLLAADELERGELVQISETEVQLGGYYFVSGIPASKQGWSARVLDWLRSSLAPAANAPAGKSAAGAAPSGR
jgi:DNA-binding transcriptional LysR family regulator